ncbi:MAG: hypothetical protein KDA24_00350 [Deltaproteobacteria bacterium]|nr:hypothetical protein [Deltaproteobacteria bacterium]
MRLFLRPLLLLLVVGLALPSMAFAQKKKKGEVEEEAGPTTDSSAILLYGPTGEDRSGAALEALQGRMEEGELPPARTLGVQEWLGAARFRLGGSAKELPCTTPDPKLKYKRDEETEIAALNKKANGLLADLEPEGALAQFLVAHGRLSCQTTYIDQDTFWESFFYAGIAAFYTGDSQGSRAHFRQAAAIAPERKWDASYPPEPQSTFLSAVQDVVARPKGKVFGDLRDTNYSEVWLDGRPLDLTKAFELEVYPGRHLIQAVDADGRWSTWVYDIREGATLTFFSAVGLEEMVLDGPDGVLGKTASNTVAKKAREAGLDHVYVVRLGDDGKPLRVWYFETRTIAWTRLERSATGEITRTTVATEEVELTPEEKNRQAFLRKPDYRASVAVGFKFFELYKCGPQQAIASTDTSGRERCPDGSYRKSPHLGGIIGIDINLIQGLNLDIRFGALATDFSVGGNVLPEAEVGFRYRFLQGVLQPFIAVAGDFFFGTYRENSRADDEFALYVGPSGYGGVEFEFPDGFRLTLEGGGGVILSGEGSSKTWPHGHVMLAIGRFLP